MKSGWDSLGSLEICFVRSSCGAGSDLLSWRYQAWPGLAVSLEFQTWSSLLAICSMVRTVTGGLGSASVMEGLVGGRSKLSCSLMRSQFGLDSEPPDLPCMR